MPAVLRWSMHKFHSCRMESTLIVVAIIAFMVGKMPQTRKGRPRGRNEGDQARPEKSDAEKIVPFMPQEGLLNQLKRHLKGTNRMPHVTATSAYKIHRRTNNSA